MASSDEPLLRSSGFHADPFPTYGWLRDEHPVYLDETRGTYALTRYVDVRDAARDHRRFSSAATRSEVFDRITRMDPPEHDVWRALLAARFRPRRIATLRYDVAALARELLVRNPEEIDVVGDYAAAIPSTMIGDLIGLDRRHHLRCHVLSEISIAGTPHAAAEANQEIYEMFEPLIERRYREPADDLVTALSTAEIDGHPLTREQLLGYCLHLVVAGNDTTANLIATGVVLLARDVELRRRLITDTTLIPLFVEELLRFDGPVQVLYRTTTESVELHGATIPAGAPVELYWGAANRDERQFDQPDVLDIGRAAPQHLGFGHGVHFCLGAHLARLEAIVAFEELLVAAPDFALVEGQQLRIKPGWAIRGYEAAKVRLMQHVGA